MPRLDQVLSIPHADLAVRVQGELPREPLQQFAWLHDGHLANPGHTAPAAGITFVQDPRATAARQRDQIELLGGGRNEPVRVGIGNGVLRFSSGSPDTLFESPANHLTAYDSALQVALERYAALSGKLCLHAAGVRFARAAPLVLGSSGQGKTTFASAAIMAGLPVVSDDSLWISANQGPGVTALYARAPLLARTPLGESADWARHSPVGPIGKYLLPREPIDQGGWAIDRMTPDRLLFLDTQAPTTHTRISRQLPQATTYSLLLRNLSALYHSPLTPRERESALPVLARLAKLPGYRIAIDRAIIKQPEQVVCGIEDLLCE